ncbi:uncharacterized protein I303_104606 [Kwoniella dejecticola CBS 10117]|uniref:Uncharacterized protein n=1 Tax=Kwoniella dejecticola CBS 10117 TaxID=1296121 RepID=A0A1A6A4V0_9TREE|nr:uncharacterized protein I303_04416 [Kwoniella dejecticola CBS 10117]OBR85085.1 hypothetical protein I303_04416 [Kwoniella dejecticola CBS 10117]
MPPRRPPFKDSVEQETGVRGITPSTAGSERSLVQRGKKPRSFSPREAAAFLEIVDHIVRNGLVKAGGQNSDLRDKSKADVFSLGGHLSPAQSHLKAFLPYLNRGVMIDEWIAV